MTEMTQTPSHAKPVRRRDHLWVLFAIAFPAAVEVWASWVGVGSRSGFPVIQLPFHLAALSTGFSLAVGMEAYWGYALYVWLAAAPGPRSRAFAMKSAIGAFVLSLLGQIAYHLMLAEHVAATPVAVVVFVAALPVTLLALVAFLIHLMHADRRAAADAERQAVLEAERTALRAQLDALTSELEAARADRETAHRELAEALTRADRLAAKVEALSAKKGGPKPRKDKSESAHAGDLTTEFRAFELLRDNPELRAPRMGAELGRKLGASAATGRRLHGRLIVGGQLVQPLTDPLSERSADQSDERS